MIKFWGALQPSTQADILAVPVTVGAIALVLGSIYCLLRFELTLPIILGALFVFGTWLRVSAMIEDLLKGEGSDGQP